MTDIVELAQQVATEAHDGQFRWDKKTPYITHPASVAVGVIAAVAQWDDDPASHAVAAAWLHDVVEDTDVTLDDLQHVHSFPWQVVTAVDRLTKRDGQSYTDYIKQVASYAVSRVVKIADIQHNSSSLPKKKGARWDKYQLALYILQRTL